MLALAYGGGDARQLRLASGGEQPDTEPDAADRSSLGLHFLNKIPILYTVLGFILIIGIIYYALFEAESTSGPRAGRVRSRRDPAGVVAARRARLARSGEAS